MAASAQFLSDQFMLGGVEPAGSKDSFDIVAAEMGEEEGKPDRGGFRVLEDGQLQVEAALPARMAGHRGYAVGCGIGAVKELKDGGFLEVRIVETGLQEARVSLLDEWQRSHAAPGSSCSPAGWWGGAG